MKKVFICIYGDVSKHPRVLMEIDALKKDFQVFCGGFGNQRLNQTIYFNIEGLHVPNYKRVRFKVARPFIPFVYRFYKIIFQKTYREIKNFEDNIDYVPSRVFNVIKKTKPELLIIHHPYLLPLAKKFHDQNIPVIFNAHEFYPEILASEKEWDEIIKQRITSQLKKYLPFVNSLFVVSNGIKERYRQAFNIDSVLITNAKPFYDIRPNLPHAHKIKLVHHGSSIPIRKLEETIEVIHFLPDNYTLDLYLLPVYEEYHHLLIKKYKNNSRIKFNPIVPTTELPIVLNQYDIGICMFPPVNFNLEMTLPNKFFEYVQARAAIVSGPSPELKYYIEKYQLGSVSEEFNAKSLAETILKIPFDKLIYFKNQAHKYAKELSYEKELIEINKIAHNLINKNLALFS